jgi:hypothetical protein
MVSCVYYNIVMFRSGYIGLNCVVGERTKKKRFQKVTLGAIFPSPTAVANSLALGRAGKMAKGVVPGLAKRVTLWPIVVFAANEPVLVAQPDPLLRLLGPAAARVKVPLDRLPPNKHVFYNTKQKKIKPRSISPEKITKSQNAWNAPVINN